MRYAGRFFDGKTAKPQPVSVRITTYGLSILPQEVEYGVKEKAWEFKDIEVTDDPQRNRPLRLANNAHPGERLVIDTPDFYKLIALSLPKCQRSPSRVTLSSKTVLLWSTLSVAILLGVFWGVPRLAVPLANYIPQQWQETLGEHVVEIISRSRSVCHTPQGDAALHKLVSRLTESAGGNKPYRVQVVKDEKILNAFAAPGGEIILFSKVLTEAEQYEEVAGVLGHEIGHIVHNHPMEGVVRAMGMMVVLSAIFNDVSGATAIYTASSLLEMEYSRDAEREADKTSTEILYASGIDNMGFIRFVERLQKEEKRHGNKASFSLLFSHPLTEERIAMIRNAPKAEVNTPLLSKKEWIALKTICDAQK